MIRSFHPNPLPPGGGHSSPQQNWGGILAYFYKEKSVESFFGILPAGGQVCNQERMVVFQSSPLISLTEGMVFLFNKWPN
jgi:hypothetical protein